MKTILIIVAVCTFIFIVLAFLFLYRMGEPVNPSVSDSYYHHAWKQKIIYAPMGNWFELGYTETAADPKTFTVLSNDFGKDNQSIFWKGEIQLVDYRSFVIDEKGIPKDATQVYYRDNFGSKLKVVVDADPQTYQPFPSNKVGGHLWHKDHQSVFLYGRKVEADGKTFALINQSLAYDSLFLYAIVTDFSTQSGTVEDHTTVLRKKERPVGKPEAINENYARSGNTILLSNWKNDFALLPFDEIKSIRIYNGRNIIINNELISDGKLMPEIDVPTLEVIDRDFLKDKHAVYYDTQLISGADATTFSVISEVYSKDKQHVFYKNTVLANASPENFTINYATNIATDGILSFKDGVQVTK